MNLGEKMKTARLEAGLSQRQLCGEAITRNMLSQIEHGTASPSMDTLRYLAARLGKPVSWFLEETVCSPNQQAIFAARAAFRSGDDFGALEALADFREPDPVFEVERNLMESLALLGAGEKALRDGRQLYALDLLSRAETLASPWTDFLKRRRLLLLARAGGEPEHVCAQLPGLDEELLLRAEAALRQGNTARAAALLDSVEDQIQPRWQYLRGEVWLGQQQYASAARCYHNAEEALPDLTAPKLEQCYRELGDYKQAYFYACRQKKQE